MNRLPISLDYRRFFNNPGVWVIFLGAGLRLYAAFQTYVINPDGTLYIHQARALYYGLFKQVTPCGTGFLSNYALFIAGAFPFFGDWIQAARAVSILFGTLTLAPLYFLLRRFFNEKISALGLLVYACMPVLVGRSADVIRDPVYWFFLVLGMYFFTARRWAGGYVGLIMASLSLLMAAWARVEAMVAVLTSALFLIAMVRDRRFVKLAVFITPVLVLAACSFGAAWFLGTPPSGLYRTREILEKASGPLSHYRLLRTHLAQWAPRIQDPVVRRFLPESRNFVWLVALGTFFNRTLEAFFYPLFAVFTFGVIGIGKRLKEEPVLVYFLMLIAAAAITLYLHILHWWILDNRHMAIVIFPSAVFAGFGVECILFWLSNKFKVTEKTAFCLLLVLIIGFTLPKNLQSREKDKLVFKEIGEKAAQISGNMEPIHVAASMDTLRWFSFYANLRFPGAPCPHSYNDFNAVVGKNYATFLSNLRSMGVHYFLWEEKHWSWNRFDFLKKDYQKDFTEIARWTHRDTGQMILFQLHPE